MPHGEKLSNCACLKLKGFPNCVKIKVLETIAKMHAKSSLPAPFSQNCQYKNNQTDDGDQSDQGGQKTPAGPAAKAKKSSGSKKKKKKKSPAQLSQVKRVDTKIGEGDSLGSGGQGYQPHQYSLARKGFIDNLKAGGVSAKDAVEQWNASPQKRSMLSTLSLQELKRRRFVAKDCQENPWAN